MLDQFLTLSFTGEGGESSIMAPRLLDQPGKGLLEHKGISRPPVTPFRSDYIGHSVSSLVPIFNAMVDAEDDSAPATYAQIPFLVFDEQSLRDRTVCAVAAWDESDDVQTIRTDFTMALKILNLLELKLIAFDEHPYTAYFYERGECVTVEAFRSLREERKRREEEKQARKKAIKARMAVTGHVLK